MVRQDIEKFEERCIYESVTSSGAVKKAKKDNLIPNVKNANGHYEFGRTNIGQLQSFKKS